MGDFTLSAVVDMAVRGAMAVAALGSAAIGRRWRLVGRALGEFDLFERSRFQRAAASRSDLAPPAGGSSP